MSVPFSPTRSSLLSHAATLVVVTASIVLPLAVFDATPVAAVLGAGSWIAGYIGKILLAGLIHVSIAPEHVRRRAIVGGATSSLSELGLAAAVLAMSGQAFSTADVVVFATAAGATEAVLVLGAAYLQKTDGDEAEAWLRGAACSLCVRYIFLIERVVALAGHFGSRGLICLAVIGSRYDLAAFALMSFALTDGLAEYGMAKTWNWFDATTCRRFYTACALISAAEVALFLVFLRRVL